MKIKSLKKKIKKALKKIKKLLKNRYYINRYYKEKISEKTILVESKKRRRYRWKYVLYFKRT